MTAGTKAILLLSVVGLIVLVAWYGEGPPQEQGTPDGGVSSQVTDPLLASASESRSIRQTRSSATVERAQSPSRSSQREMSGSVSERWGAFRQPQANRQSPPPPPARSNPASETIIERHSSSNRQPPTLEMGADVDTSRTGSWSQWRSSLKAS